MQTDQDLARIVRSWLDEGATALPDRVLDAVLDQVPATRQRRSLWPSRRFAEMNTYAKLAIAAAAVVVVAIVGYNLLPARGGDAVGGPAVTAAPSASPSPSEAIRPSAGPLEPDTRYRVDLETDITGARTPVEVSFAVPATGWTYDGEFWFHYAADGDEGELWFIPSDGVPGIFTDACAHTGLQQFEDSIAGEAEAYAAEPGALLIRATADTTVAGRAAKALTISVPEDIGCVNSEYWLTHDPECGIELGCTYYPTWLDNTMRYWIIDVDGSGQRLTFLGSSRNPTSGTLEPQFQLIANSIDFP
jgi:hypothetical protein